MQYFLSKRGFMNDTQMNRLSITNRQELCANGIERVVGFDDDYVLIETKDGRITIEGADLAIESLNKDSGEIEIKGRISAVIYSDARREHKGILARILK